MQYKPVADPMKSIRHSHSKKIHCRRGPMKTSLHSHSNEIHCRHQPVATHDTACVMPLPGAVHSPCPRPDCHN